MPLRPSRSPRLPKTMPPSGRIAKATAKTPKVFNRPTVTFSLGKNCAAMTVARNP